jgi:hypothetical protein
MFMKPAAADKEERRGRRGLTAVLHILIAGLLAVMFSAAPARAGGEPYFTYTELLLRECAALPGKTYDDMLKILPVSQLAAMLHLCDSAGFIQPVKGTALTVTAPKNVRWDKPLPDPRLHFRDDELAVANGRILERYNLWFASDTHFAMRIANYTQTSLSRVLIGFINGTCGEEGREKFETLTLVSFRPVAPKTERVVKWRLPEGLEFEAQACVIILRGSSD